MPSLGGKGPTARHISLPVARLPTPLRISPSPKRGGVTQAQWDEYPQLQMLPVLITKNIRPTIDEGGTNSGFGRDCSAIPTARHFSFFAALWLFRGRSRR